MTDRLAFHAGWESKRDGTPEEIATFAALGVKAGDLWLTEAEDRFVQRIREAPLLSAYPLAEWLAWNWWRLRWEPRRQTAGWAMSHRMSAVGGGYVWPDLVFEPDGERVELLASPTASRPAEPLRYVTSAHASVSAAAFEQAVDALFAQTLDRLGTRQLRDTNLARLVEDLAAERGDTALADYRRLEAQLGFDPGAAEETEVESMLAARTVLGEAAVGELAAAATGYAGVTTPEKIESAAEAAGIDARLADAIRIPGLHLRSGDAEPWRLGVRLANELRRSEGLGLDPIADARLAGMIALRPEALTAEVASRELPLGFAISRGTRDRVVLRSRRGDERRFEVARLLADLSLAEPEPLRPLTHSRTFRQKAQRACAAQLLCPIEGLTDRLAGDFEDDSVQAAADHYGVSPWVARHQLTNNDVAPLYA